jgi:hypothetical protein
VEIEPTRNALATQTLLLPREAFCEVIHRVFPVIVIVTSRLHVGNET